MTVLSNTRVQSTGSGFCRLIFISSVSLMVDPGFTLGYNTKSPKSLAFLTDPLGEITKVLDFTLCFEKPPTKLLI